MTPFLKLSQTPQSADREADPRPSRGAVGDDRGLPVGLGVAALVGGPRLGGVARPSAVPASRCHIRHVSTETSSESTAGCHGPPSTRTSTLRDTGVLGPRDARDRHRVGGDRREVLRRVDPRHRLDRPELRPTVSRARSPAGTG